MFNAINTVSANLSNDTIPVSLFDHGMARQIFSEVRKSGAKVVTEDDNAECILLSPEAYAQLIDDIEDSRLLAIAEKRLSHYDPDKLITQEEMNKILGITQEDIDNFEEVEIE